MNESRERSDFRNALETLLRGMEQEVSDPADGAIVGSSEPGVLEHVTRRLFLDGLLTELGWSLGPRGDVAEEARLRAKTTLFIDYMGVSDVKTPLLIVEAKAWDVPFISARGRTRSRGMDLLVLTIEHLKSGKAREESPAALAWYDYLDQIAGYVHELKTRYGHDVPRVVLTSGQWLVIFVSPTKTFMDETSVDEGQIVILQKNEYVAEARQIIDLLSRRKLAGDGLSILRPGQLGGYISGGALASVFHGVHLRYEATGSSRFVPKPRILVYPTIILLRADGAMLLVMEENDFPLDERQDSIASHLSDVEAAALRLLQRCSDALDLELRASAVAQFPGFPRRQRQGDPPATVPLLVHDPFAGDEWLMVTGEATHYLRSSPVVDCRFHEWSSCHDEGRACGMHAVSLRTARSPRSFFTDGQTHHCAHQDMIDMRDQRCHIAAIDSRTCCSACHYSVICWPTPGSPVIPCGR